MSARWWIPLCVAALQQGCAPIPAPSVLEAIARVRESPSAKGAERDAPRTYALAEKLRRDAEAAFEAEDAAGAQILGEQALAAYEQAVAEARTVRAEKARQTAAFDADKAQARLDELDQEHQAVAADITAVEERLKVLRALEPPSPSAPASPAREKARWQAVAALQLGARLLCTGAEMLAVSRKASDKSFVVPTAVTDAKATLAELNAAAADRNQPAPIDLAMRSRASCLAALTEVRRGAADPKKATGAGDALLEELSKLGHGTPRRDDRGVVVTLRDVFQGEVLSEQGHKAIEAIAKVAAQHQRFPVIVVLHDDKPLEDPPVAATLSRGAKVVTELRAVLGADRVSDAVLAGDASPVVDPSSPHRKRNQRVDVVFVSPEAL